MPDTLVKVEGVSKKFCINLKRSLWYGLQDLGREFVGRRHGANGKLRESEFWAVKDVSFELKRGECLGLLGRNGAGKTTMLRMLNGLIKPNHGRIEMNGVVGAIIALGAGMKEVLTGRENAYAMLALRGVPRSEADRKIEEIIDFSEIKEMIDAPLQSYSSGMNVRLNFAIASSLETDVLLLDEVLAVGDAAFRDKCYHRIAQLRKKAAVIFVSHNMEQVARTSTHALVLHKGETAYAGEVDGGIRLYEALNSEFAREIMTEGAFLSFHPPIKAFSATLESWRYQSGKPMRVEINFLTHKPMAGFAIKIVFYNARGAISAEGFIANQEMRYPVLEGHNRINLRINSLSLKSGEYAITIILLDDVGDMVVWCHKMHSITLYGTYVGATADCYLQISDVGKKQGREGRD